MKVTECSREQDVVVAVSTRRYPDRLDVELRDHIAGCATCQDVATVAAAMMTEHEYAWPDVQVPSAARVWWRTQMRARQEAERAALRPITVVQAVTAVLVAVMTFTAIGFGWMSGGWSLERASGVTADAPTVASTALNTFHVFATGTGPTLLVLGMIAAGLVLMPVAVYLALSE